MDTIKFIRRGDVPGLRQTLGKLGIIIAETDRQLCYRWIENPHPVFTPDGVVGRRDDELLPEKEALGISALKREVFKSGKAATRLLSFQREDGERFYSVTAYPVLDEGDKIDGVITIGFESEGPRR